MTSQIAAILSLALLPAACFGQESLQGTWKVEAHVAERTVTRTCDFKQEGQTLTGTCKSDSLPSVDIQGTVTEEKVMWKYTVDVSGNALTMVYSGKLTSGKEIKGTVEAQSVDVSGEFTATRVP